MIPQSIKTAAKAFYKYKVNCKGKLASFVLANTFLKNTGSIWLIQKFQISWHTPIQSILLLLLLILQLSQKLKSWKKYKAYRTIGPLSRCQVW